MITSTGAGGPQAMSGMTTPAFDNSGNGKSQVTRFLNKDGGQSFMPGATWEFDDDSLKNMKKTQQGSSNAGMSIGE